MKNEKILRVCDVVLKIINLLGIIAQAVKATFPAESQQVVSQSDAHIIKDFMNEDLK